MSRKLPYRPNLDHLKNEAKSLLKSHKQRDKRACEPLRQLARFAEAPDREILESEVGLQEAQHALAREYCFAGWKELKDYVEEKAALAGKAIAAQEVYAAKGPADDSTGSPWDMQRREQTHELLKAGEEGFRVAVELSRSPNGRSRFEMAVFFGLSKDERAAEHLRRLLGDESARVRAHALRFYAARIHPADRFNVHGIAEPAPSVPEGIEAIFPLLADANVKVREHAAWVLSAYGGLHNARIETALRKVLNDPKHIVRHRAAGALSIPCPGCGKPPGPGERPGAGDSASVKMKGKSSKKRMLLQPPPRFSVNPERAFRRAKARRRGLTLEVPGIGACLLPYEFLTFTGLPGRLETHDARESPRDLHSRLANGTAIVLTGPYAYVDAIYHYCQRFERGLVSTGEFAHIENPGQRTAAFAEARRRKLHHLLVVAEGDRLLEAQDAPDTVELQEWLQEPIATVQVFLIPVRRLQRILTDMRRAREGVSIPGLNATITIRPHVYVPSDASVPAMFAEYARLIEGNSVLDMRTGTGVLALLAAKFGATRVTATDSNAKAVANVRANVERFGLGNKIDVRGPADLFASVPGETFDIILFNAPWIQGQPHTLYDTALYDPCYRVIGGFLRAAPEHLADGGAILLQYSDISQRNGDGGMNHLNALLAASGLCIAGSANIARMSRVLGARERVYLFEICRSSRVSLSAPQLSCMGVL